MAREDRGTELRRGRLPAPRLERPRPRLAGESDVIWTRGAARRPGPAQWTAIVLGLGLPTVGIVLAPTLTHALLHPVLFALFSLAALTRLAAALTPPDRTPVAPLPDDALPRYSIIAPMYREAEVAAQLVRALEQIDYPRDRLQVLIVLEADDADTWNALADLPLPTFIQVLAAPPAAPRTKPRACNVALERATGDLLTIYDAEDRPGPGQLREAAARFATGSPRLACLQAPLRIDHDRRFLPGQFGLEYAIQFEAVLPLLARLGLPFPLGGTSNHFRIGPLRALGGWDAWNVTEDADLGFRLAAEGYELGVLTTPTLEAPPATMSEWLPQRARWVKGYMQTFGVQARQPPHWRTGVMAGFAVTLGVAIASAFGHAPLLAWTATAIVLGLVDGEAWIAGADAALLAAGWACAAAAAVTGSRRAGRPLTPLNLLAMPFYWPLHSLAAAHALYQLIRSPYRWDKTPHAPRTGQAGA